MQRLAAAQRRQHDIEFPGAATQRRVVGHRQIGEDELVHAPRETLQRAQRQAKHLFESEQHLDDRVGVHAWTATLGGTGFGAPLPQARLHPDRHITSRNQPCVVGRPVVNPVLALGLLPLLFVLAHRSSQKARIYASSSKVNSPAAPTVARKRHPSPRRGWIYATTPCQRIKLIGERHRIDAIDHELVLANHVHEFDAGENATDRPE
jgi:hypothetical protein